ncbi:MAG TPA: DeoR/GlpR family DNA-binding transcription regulator [Sinorhizobium sp.]|nr:DeoR/GlpR family DNA-binding transcription regulator [Sinorhizobium sp.]
MDESLKKKSRRQQELLTFLEKTGYASVEELTTAFSVTSQTIRRDIADLSDFGKVRRYHGGVALSGPIDPGTYRLRRIDKAETKRKIAERVAELVPDGAAIFLDAGSTCEAVAEALARRRGLKVVTYSLRAAVLLTERTDFTIAVPGGFVRHVDGSVVGDTMVDFIRRFRFDAAIIAVSGIEEDGSMGDDDQHEVAIVRAAMGQARSILLATDSSKFTKIGLVRLGSVTEVSDMVTDAPPRGPLAELIASSGVKLHIV